MSLAHSAHNNGQVPWGAAPDDELDDEPYRLGKQDDDEKHHHPHLHHCHHHHHNSPICHLAKDPVPVPARLSTSAALHASSDQSTPSQTQSTASSTFTPLSGFPSSPSRAYAAADGDADAEADTDTDALGDGTGSRDGNGAADAAYSADEAYADRTVEAPGGNVPLSGIEGLSLRYWSRPPPEHSQPQLTGLPSSPVPCASNEKDDADFAEDGGICNAVDIESLSSHALSLDQTRLRVAYLVSTMVNPTATAPVGGGFGHPSEYLTQGVGGVHLSVPVPASQEFVVSATVGRKQVSKYRVAVDDVTGAALLPRYQGLPNSARRTIPPVLPLNDLVQWFDNNCPSVWANLDAAKKQQKIYTAAMWQTEVTALGAATYCSCPNGEDAIRHKLKLLATAATNASCCCEPTTDAVVATGEQPSGLEHPDLAAGGADRTDEMATGTVKFCSACGHPLPPRRPVVWVRGAGWPVRAQEAAGDTIRRAFKSLRGLVVKKKKRPGLTQETFQGPSNASRESKRPKGPREANATRDATTLASPAGSGEQEQHGKTSKQGGTEQTSPWDQWDQLNCANLFENPTTAEAFFPRTAIYRNVAEAVEQDDDESDWSSSKEDDNADTRAQRRKRETERRLQRAQRLLTQTHAPQASAATAVEADAADAAAPTAEEPADMPIADGPADAAPPQGPLTTEVSGQR